MAPHATSRRTYFIVAAVLLALTAATYFVALVDLGAFNTAVAVAIAIVKASLIALFFMHVRGSSRLTWLVILVAVAWAVGLIVGTLDDYLTRSWLPEPGR